MKFKPPILPTDPSPEQWKWWKAVFTDGLVINEVNEDGHKLTFLKSHAGPELFPLLQSATTFADAIAILDRQFDKPTRVIYARHKLLTCRQNDGESISDYIKRMKLLVEACECTNVDAKQHQDLLLRDALVSGLRSDQVRARLLELDNTKTVEDCIALAKAIDLSLNYSKSFQGEYSDSQSSLSVINDNTSTSSISAVAPRRNEKLSNERRPQQQSATTCSFCSLKPHPRSRCPAKRDTCYKCGKMGHWGKACKSSSVSAQHEEEGTVASVLCATSGKVNKTVYEHITIGNHRVLALIDPGATDCFVSIATVNRFALKYTRCSSSTRMANGDSLEVMGYHDAEVTIKNVTHSCRFLVVQHLIAEAIVGMELLGRHQRVALELGGPEPPITFDGVASISTQSTFPMMKVEPPKLFTDELRSAKPIATKVRHASRDDAQFIQDEVQRLLAEGIIEESVSAWRAQAFVVHGHKRRMVIDYSQTVNLFTATDAYPFPDVESILNRAASYKYFSKIDLKSAYHQIPIREEDRKFTAFQARGKLYQFTRIPFGVTNAVPAFQRIMDNFIERNHLKGTEPFLDDIYVGGRTLAEHDHNLKKFMESARRDNLTLNLDKCTFRVTKISLLGHIIEGGTKRPDPDRLKTLLDYPNPTNVTQLRRLVGFFAYYAKWVNKYSTKVEPLLSAMKGACFPLNSVCIAAISEMKSEIAAASLAVPVPDNGPIVIETDASGVAIGAVMTQAERPLAFFSRSLSMSERKQSSVEREAMAIVEAMRKWHEFVRSFKTIIKTDQKSVSYIFSHQKSRIKNDKLMRWRLELSEYIYEIVYRPGPENTAADSLSRVATISLSKSPSPCAHLHEKLHHPGIVRMWEFIRRHNYAFSLDDVKKTIAGCATCREVKPKFYKPAETAPVIRSLQPFERLSMDIVGPKTPAFGTGNVYALTLVDEYSRFPFAFGLKTITTESIVRCLRSLFAVFGCPAYIHTDRGRQFVSSEFDSFCSQNGIAHSRTTPYRPGSNGQCERYNGTIFKTIRCILHSRKLETNMWETVLPEALDAVRSLLCTSTNESPHSRLFRFNRRSSLGCSLPKWLSSGNSAYLRNYVRNKEDPLVQPVTICEVINPHYARVSFDGGRIDTVSTKDLAPGVDSREMSTNGLNNNQTSEDLDVSQPDTVGLDQNVHEGTMSKPENDEAGPTTEEVTDKQLNIKDEVPTKSSDEPVLRRSGRNRKLPDKLREFVI